MVLLGAACLLKVLEAAPCIGCFGDFPETCYFNFCCGRMFVCKLMLLFWLFFFLNLVTQLARLAAFQAFVRSGDAGQTGAAGRFEILEEEIFCGGWRLRFSEGDFIFGVPL